MNRRRFLTVLGGGIVVAAGGIGWRFSRKPQTALLPWEQAGTKYQEPRLKALSFALLAPNPHNRQPWLVDVSTPDTVRLFVDTEKLLPHTDPFNRQITVGLGCFTELMVMAAAQDGYDVNVELFPKGANSERLDQRPIFEARFDKSTTKIADPLFQHVLNRRSVKEPYDLQRAVENDKLERIAKAATGTTIGHANMVAKVQALRELTEQALMIEFETHRTYKESVDLFRIGASEVDANPDGIDFSGPFFEALNTTGLFSRDVALDRDSVAYSGAIDIVKATTQSAMAHMWQITAGNSRHDQIQAGRDWMRLHLAVTGEGLSLQPLSQALQEYPEMKELYKDVHKRLAPDGGTVQMLARLGYAKPIPASPRWPLEAKLKKGQG